MCCLEGFTLHYIAYAYSMDKICLQQSVLAGEIAYKTVLWVEDISYNNVPWVEDIAFNNVPWVEDIYLQH